MAFHYARLAEEVLSGLRQQQPPDEQWSRHEAYYQLSVMEASVRALLSRAQQLYDLCRTEALESTLAEVDVALLQAQALAAQEGSLHDQMLLGAHQAHFCFLHGQRPRALDEALQSLELAQQMGQKPHLENVLLLAHLYELASDWPRAQQIYDQALPWTQQRPRELQEILGRQAVLYEQTGDLAGALKATREALLQSQKLICALDDLAVLDEEQPALSLFGQQELTWQERLKLAEEQAQQDPLTGLLNRRGLEQKLVQWTPEAGHRDICLMVGLLDVDHFKSINDNFSHGVGDEVLKTVALLLQNTLPPETLLARYGGEEFLVVLPVARSQRAWSLLDLCRGRVEAHDWSPLLGQRPLTLSGGYALGSGQDFVALLSRADEALYHAKQGGRNLVWQPLTEY